MAVVRFSKSKINKEFGLDRFMSTLYKMGMPTEEDGEDVVIEITPNRPDLFGWFGVKRAFLNYEGIEKPRRYVAKRGEYSIENKVGSGRKYIYGLVAKNSKIDLVELIQMQEKLTDTLGRKRRKVAIGIHDLSKVKFPLVYDAKRHDKFVPLGHSLEMTLDQMAGSTEQGRKYYDGSGIFYVLRDSEKVISVPPIINSEATRLEESTRDFFVDVTGTSEKAVLEVLRVLACEFIDSGADVYTVSVNRREEPSLEYKEAKVDAKKVVELGGFYIDQEGVVEALEKMGFYVDGERVFAQPYRVDLWGEVDLIEDVVIGYGFDKLDADQLKLPFMLGRTSDLDDQIKEVMVGMGFTQVFNSFLCSNSDLKRTGLKSEVEILNPASDYNAVKPSSLVSYLVLLEKNKTKKLPIKLFSLERVFKDGEEREVVSIIIGSHRDETNEVRAAVERLLYEFGLEYEISGGSCALLQQGRQAIVSNTKGDVMGVFGLVNLSLIEEFGLPFGVYFAELEKRFFRK
ncbi:MAG: phenylalanine--tRNA ligase subunit beta [Candidatus Anstonellales archaeon]